MTEKVGKMEENETEERIVRVRKEVLGYVQAVVGKKNFLFQFKYWHNRYIGSCFITHLCSEEGVGHKANKPISDLPKNTVDC